MQTYYLRYTFSSAKRDELPTEFDALHSYLPLSFAWTFDKYNVSPVPSRVWLPSLYQKILGSGTPVALQNITTSTDMLTSLSFGPVIISGLSVKFRKEQ